MELGELVREALELQVLERAPERAAAVVGAGVSEHGAVAVAGALLEAAAVALRRMVTETGEAYDRAELVSGLALDRAVPEKRLELLGEALTLAAATAGGVRPPLQAAARSLGERDLLFGSWLGLLAVLRIASAALEQTEAELVEQVVASAEAF